MINSNTLKEPTKRLNRIFISRKLHSKSDFKKKLAPYKVQINGLSLIRFEAIPFSVIPEAKWIFFYSKNGVRYFFKQPGQSQKIGKVKWAAIGSGTALALASFGIDPDFIGDGDPITTANGFLKIAQNEKVLFPCARNSLNSIAKLLEKRIIPIPFPVYDNVFRSHLPKIEADILVFTSPMNVKAWQQKIGFSPDHHIVAIGNSTAESLKRSNVKQLSIAKEPSEIALAEAVIQLIS